jgi:methyl-accepting chemotaxis protein
MEQFSHQIAFLFFAVVIFIFICKFFKDFKKETSDWTNLILGAGTCGTFVGILLALQDFNIQGNIANQQEEITTMFSSLKFVFATSILGLGTSIVLRLIRGIYKKEIQEEDQINQILVLIGEKINKDLGENFRTFDESMEKIVTFAGEHKETLEKTSEIFNTLITQKDLIADINQKFIDTTSQVREAAAEMKEASNNLKNSEQKVISDVGGQINDFTNQTITQMNELTENTKKQIYEITNFYNEFSNQTRTQIDAQNDFYKKLKNDYDSSIKKQNEEFGILIQTTLNGFSDAVKKEFEKK